MWGVESMFAVKENYVHHELKESISVKNPERSLSGRTNQPYEPVFSWIAFFNKWIVHVPSDDHRVDGRLIRFELK
jgi:hypothetical protein